MFRSEVSKMEFDKSKILTAVTADQAKVGQMGWFADDIETIELRLKQKEKRMLVAVEPKDCAFRFTANKSESFALFYPAPEPFKAGDRVVVDGYHSIATVIDPQNNEDFMYVDIDHIRTGIKKHSCKLAPEPTYRPYTDDELNDLVGEVLTNKKSGKRILVTEKSMADGLVYLNNSIRLTSSKELLENYYRNDNEPCGMEEV